MKHFLLFFALFVVGIFGFTSPTFAQQATLLFSPASQIVQSGSVFTVQVMVNTAGAQVNAVAAYFTYPADRLEVVQVDTTGSMLQFVAERTGGAGQVRISGGSPTPGFSGTQRIGTVQFRALSVGQAQLSWSSDSAVLTDVGNQNILNVPGSGTAVFQISAGQAAPPLPPPPTPPTPVPTPSPAPSPPSTGAELETMDIRATQSPEGVVVSWKTNKEAKGRVNYGPLQEVGQQQDYPFSVLGGTFLKAHSFLLPHARSPEDYVLEIIVTDRQGNQTNTEQLILTELIAPESMPEEEEEPPFPPMLEEGRGRLVLFILVPIVVLLLVGGLLFWRMRIGS